MGGGLILDLKAHKKIQNSLKESAGGKAFTEKKENERSLITRHQSIQINNLLCCGLRDELMARGETIGDKSEEKV